MKSNARLNGMNRIRRRISSATKLTPLRERRFRLARRTTAMSIVDALLALVLAATVSLAFVDFYSKLMRTTSATQNEICANTIANSMMENIYAIDYSVLDKNQGTRSLLINLPQEKAFSASTLKPSPLLNDFLNTQWGDTVRQNRFRGEAQITIKPAPVANNALEVAITVFWSDSLRYENSAGSAGRSITTSAIISKYGLNRWKS